MAYQECAKEMASANIKRDPEIHMLIQELHGLIGAQAEANDMLESRLATVSAPTPPTSCAPGQPIGCPVESLIGNELFSMKMRLQSILEQTRDMRNRLCV